ncbi:MAG: hypothetical protein HRT71_14155 [Flavobacteriales bacterium]|nr:hypothetical protein [Flavobacteriales bacterium]
MKTLKNSTKRINQLVLIIACMACFTVVTGKTKSQDVVYLKDGSVIRGTIIKSEGSPKIRILSAGNQWVFDKSEVDTISMQEEVPNVKKSITLKPKGFYSSFTVSPMHGRDKWDSGIKSFSIHYVNGYQINPHWAAGAGVGFEFFDGAFYTLFGQGTYTLSNKKFSPFAGVKLGYAMPASNYYVSGETKSKRGGIMEEFEIGTKKYLNSRVAFIASMGYRHQRTEDHYYDWQSDGIVDVKNYYHRVFVRLGFLFR